MKNINKNKKAFTLAEILITLTVIGVVAAITIPSVMASMNEKTWATQKKALLVRLTNAITDMPKIRGFGEYTETKDPETNEISITDNVAESFIVEGLSKIYKMTNICTSNNIDKCGLPENITTATGAKIPIPTKLNEIAYYSYKKNTKAASFQTANGEGIAVYYNPDCASIKENAASYGAPARMCINFLYDLNGQKAPNQMGKDMGTITVIYTDKVNIVAPVYYTDYASADKAPSFSESALDATGVCKNRDKNLRLPTIEELAAFEASGNLFGMLRYPQIPLGTYYWSSTILSSGEGGKAYAFNPWYSQVDAKARNSELNVVCVYE